MKKLTFMALAAIIAMGIASCGKSTPKANLETGEDSLAYAIGIAQSSNGLKEYLVQQYGVDSTYADEFIKGLNDGVNAGDNKKKAAYFAGIQIGQQVANQMIKGINHEIYGEDSTKTISVKNLLAGFVSGYTGKNGLMTTEQANIFAQSKMQEIKAKNMESQYGPNKKKGEDFLAKNKSAKDVKVLPSGVQYRIIKPGTGAMPTDTSSVTVNYEGKTLDGKVFDSSYKRGEPAKFKLNQVIKGWGDALKNMPAGSTWEVWIPQDLAYGSQDMGEIKPFSCLYFKIELISVGK